MRRILFRSAATLAMVLLWACTQKNTADAPNTTTNVPVGLNRFLLFPNPIVMGTGEFETDTTDYADAYYSAIDPNNNKDTLDHWKAQNGFSDSTSPLAGTELRAVFRDVKDLGYGRRMTGRRNTSAIDPVVDGSIAFYVENYNVVPNASSNYSNILNVDAAIRRDTQWHVGTNAIEWSTAPCSSAELAEGCNPNVKFAKYYNFSSKDGTRQKAVDLDGNGLKAMPGPCITCHGGRGDPLTPTKGFPLVENSVSRKRGDVQGRLHGMNVDSFEYSSDIPGYSKADQQATLKQFNQWILCTYPLAGAANGSEDNCRVAAGANEYQGTAAEMIKAWYGGPGMTSSTFSDTYIPDGWKAVNAGQTAQDLYTDVVAPFCRTCHILRGTNNQHDIDFMAWNIPAGPPAPAGGFSTYADRIKAHVFDRGTMPLAKIVYDDFWSSNAPNVLASAINGQLTPPQTVLDANGVALRPGRPVASPGPNRMVRTLANATLTAEDSLFASSYTWAQVSSNPAGLNAVIADPNSIRTNFNAPAAGDYDVQLTVSNGAQTDTKKITITVKDDFPAPESIKFAHVRNVLQNLTYTTSQVAAQKCVTCHVSPATSPTPPIFYNNFDRNGDGKVNTTDDDWFRQALQGRINLTEIEASPLLRKPSGKHHRGLMLLDVADNTTAGGGLGSYSVLYHWILAGAPGGGVAANAVVSSPSTSQAGPNFAFTFSGPVGGPYASPNMQLDGSASLADPSSVAYQWKVFGPPGPLGTPASITSATSAVTTLNVFDVGTYVVQLQVSDNSGSTDTVQQTIVVSENPITASFTPATGTSQVTFSSSPLRGPITLTSTSTGSPTTCRWQIFGPAGATLGVFPTIVTDLTQSCTSTATLVVPLASVGSSYTVQLTASNLVSSTADNFIVIAAAPGSTVGNAAFSFPGTNAIRFTINNSTSNGTQTVINGVQTNSIQLTGSATGQAPLNYAWSVSGANTAGCQTPAAGQITSLVVSKAGTCDVTLTVTNSFPGTSSVTQTVTFQQTVTFNNSIKAILGNGVIAPSFGVQADCVGCHVSPGSAIQPNWQTDGSAGQDTALRNALQTKIDTTTPRNSLIVNCPTSGCDFNGSFFLMPAGHPGFVNGSNMSNYDAFLTWIINGQP